MSLSVLAPCIFRYLASQCSPDEGAEARLKGGCSIPSRQLYVRPPPGGKGTRPLVALTEHDPALLAP